MEAVLGYETRLPDTNDDADDDNDNDNGIVTGDHDAVLPSSNSSEIIVPLPDAIPTKPQHASKPRRQDGQRPILSVPTPQSRSTQSASAPACPIYHFTKPLAFTWVDSICAKWLNELDDTIEYARGQACESGCPESHFILLPSRWVGYDELMSIMADAYTEPTDINNILNHYVLHPLNGPCILSPKHCDTIGYTTDVTNDNANNGGANSRNTHMGELVYHYNANFHTPDGFKLFLHHLVTTNEFRALFEALLLKSTHHVIKTQNPAKARYFIGYKRTTTQNSATTNTKYSIPVPRSMSTSSRMAHKEGNSRLATSPKSSESPVTSPPHKKRRKTRPSGATSPATSPKQLADPQSTQSTESACQILCPPSAIKPNHSKKPLLMRQFSEYGTSSSISTMKTRKQ